MLCPVPAADTAAVTTDPGQAVVKLFGAGIGNLDSYGTGILISPEGHMITVWNHLIHTGYLTAVTADGRRYQPDVTGTSAEHDLAVLKLQADPVDTFPYIDRTTAVRPPPGTQVRAFSNMFHVATGNEPVSVIHGIIAADVRLQAGFGRWQFPLKSPVLILDAITNNSGAAGGLVTDTAGRPVGMIGRELRHRDSGAWVNYAVPFETLNPVIDAILSGRTIESTQQTEKATPVSDRRLTADWGLTLLPDVLRETPAWIDQVVPGSVADRAGLRRGDLVVLINDQVVRSSRELRHHLGGLRSGLPVTMMVRRDDVLIPITIRVP